MATEATWQRTDATMTMEHYRAMCVRYRDDTATRMQWISRMQLQPVELFADVWKSIGERVDEDFTLETTKPVATVVLSGAINSFTHVNKRYATIDPETRGGGGGGGGS